MNDDHDWGKSPWSYELHSASIECAWVDESIRWIGIAPMHNSTMKRLAARNPRCFGLVKPTGFNVSQPSREVVDF